MIGILSLGGYDNVYGQSITNIYQTIFDISEFDSLTPMFVSMRPDVDGNGEVHLHYTYSYDCMGSVVNSGLVGDSPIYSRGRDIGGDGSGSGGFSINIFGYSARTEIYKEISKSNFEFKYTIDMQSHRKEDDHYDPRSPYTAVLSTSSFSNEMGVLSTIIDATGETFSSEFSISHGGAVPTCFNLAVLTGLSITTETNYSNSQSFFENLVSLHEQDKIVNNIEKVTSVDAYFEDKTYYNGGYDISFSKYNLSGLNFEQSSVYTEGKESSFRVLKSIQMSGDDTFLDVSYKDDNLSLGAYFNTHYEVGECQSVYTATWGEGVLGETNLFKNVFKNVGNGFIINGNSIKEQVIKDSSSSSYKATGVSGEDLGVTYYTSYSKRFHAASWDEDGDFWKPGRIVFNPSFSYKQVSGIPIQMYKAYSDLTEDRTSKLFKTYQIKVNKTLNSGLYPYEYNLRQSGILASVGISNANLYQVATINSNDSLKMKEEVELSIYEETSPLIQPWGGNNYFFNDPTTVAFDSGAYSYTLYDINASSKMEENSFIGYKLFQISSNNILSVNSLCVVIYGGETNDSDIFLGPARKRNDLVAVSESNCNNMNEFSNFSDEMFTFNAMNFPYINRKTEQTFYPDTPGFIL